MTKFTFLTLFVLLSGSLAQAQKTKVEAVAKICDNLPLSEKPIVAVAPFKIGASDVATVGTGLSDMLMNALLNCGCFRVVERERMNDIMNEQGLGLSGAGNEASFASVGKQLGAQLLVMGTITEFSENESGGGIGGALLNRVPGVAGAAMKKAHIGFTVRLVNPSTGEIVSMQSFDKKRNSVGLAGASFLGSAVAGAVFYKSKAMQDAVEEGLIDAVQFIASKRSDFTAVLAASASGADKPVDLAALKSNCPVLQLARPPKIMVIIPEEHLAGAGSAYDPNTKTINVNVNSSSSTTSAATSTNASQGNPNPLTAFFRPPDPAGETEIIKKLLEFGYEVVDSKQYEKLRADKDFLGAFESPELAGKLAAKFGADIIIVGEAFSEFSKSATGMSSCRARVEAKAVLSANARILAADGLFGSGMDVSEVIAGKTALRNAGTKIAEYFLAQLCAKSDIIAGTMGSRPKTTAATMTSAHTTEIKISNIDYAKIAVITKTLLAVKGVQKAERTAYADKAATFSVNHDVATDALLEKLLAAPTGLKLDITEVNGDKVNIVVKGIK